MLLFDNTILDMEEQADWLSATEYAYQCWHSEPMDLNALLCAGTELWYSLLMIDYYEFAPSKPTNYRPPDANRVQELLCTITRWGFEHFSKDALFNVYFGYMIKVMPYFFLDYLGDYDGWKKKGIDMIGYAFQLSPDHPFIKAIYFGTYFSDQTEIVHPVFKEYWNRVSYENLPKSHVNNYFAGILCRELFC